MKRTATDLLMIALVFLAFIAGCNWNQPEPCNPVVIPGKETVKREYVYLKDSTTTKPKPKKVYPVPPPPVRPSAGIDTAGDALVEALNDSIREYELYYSDSAVKVNTTVQGVLLSQHVQFRQTNTYITRVDTVIKPPKTQLFAGAQIGFNQIAAQAILVHNRSYIIGGYDLIGRMPVVGYGVRLYQSKK